MNVTKKKISVRERMRRMEDVLSQLIRTVTVVSSTFEQYLTMKGDTEDFVKYLEGMVKNEEENKEKLRSDGKKGKKEQTKRSRTTKTSS